jgi:hypothetical protein
LALRIGCTVLLSETSRATPAVVTVGLIA